MVRIASFNVENLFARPNAFNSTNLNVGKPVLDAYRDVRACLAYAASQLPRPAA